MFVFQQRFVRFSLHHLSSSVTSSYSLLKPSQPNCSPSHIWIPKTGGSEMGPGPCPCSSPSLPSQTHPLQSKSPRPLTWHTSMSHLFTPGPYNPVLAGPWPLGEEPGWRWWLHLWLPRTELSTGSILSFQCQDMSGGSQRTHTLTHGKAHASTRVKAVQATKLSPLKTYHWASPV